MDSMDSTNPTTGSPPADDPDAKHDGERITAQRWATALGEQSSVFSPQRFWLAVPEVYRRHQEKLTRGRTDATWWEYCLGEFLKDRLPAPRMLSIGCGAGQLERTLAGFHAFQACDACDLSPDLIASASRAAQAAGITSIAYAVRDANTCEFPAQAYDAVWFNHSLHHIEALEHACAAVARALTPDGYVFIHEYVGPSRFDYPAEQKAAADRAFALIPPRFRHSFGPRDPGAIRERLVFPDPGDVRAADPSESVRSADILNVLARYFEIVTRNDGGGTLLQLLLQNIAGNFRTDDPDSVAVLNMLFAIEDTLLAIGDLRSDYVLVVARPKAG
ncbi:MAG TPA: class I SAM-dependent methyltransferase [Ktedonobacterales bacterium]|jgi:SAM-dependent methyltransferase